MARHEILLSIQHGLPVVGKDVEFVVKADGSPLGRVRISKGSIDWLPSPKSAKCYEMTWENFAGLMVANGKPKKK